MSLAPGKKTLKSARDFTDTNKCLRKTEFLLRKQRSPFKTHDRRIHRGRQMANPLVEQCLRAMWREFRRTRCPRLRECLVEYHLSLVRRVAVRMHRRLPEHVRLDDLTAAGNFGLL